MPVDFSRSERIGVALQRQLSELVPRLKDPRLGMVTIQEVRVTRDLSHAKVYFTVLDRDHAKQMGKILAHAAGFLRRRLAEVMKLRTVPELHFIYDVSIEEGQRLSALIEQAVARDAGEKTDG